MSKKFIWLSVIALVLTLGQASYACTGDPKHCNAHHRFDNLAKELNLTVDQKAKIKAYREQARASLKSSYAQLRSLRGQVNDIVKANKIDEAKLNALVDKISNIRSSMLKTRIMMQHHMYTLLNDKQKAKFLELKKKWHENHIN